MIPSAPPGQPQRRQPLSKRRQVDIFRRDQWLCRWCHRPVIFAPVMRLLEREMRAAGETRQLAYHHAHWTRDGAPLLDELGAVIDHVAAFSTGGACTEDNLFTACNKCNGRKSAASVGKWNERPKPRPVKGKYGEPQHWDGFSTLFALLAGRSSVPLAVSEQGWLKALTTQ